VRPCVISFALHRASRACCVECAPPAGSGLSSSLLALLAACATTGPLPASRAWSQGPASHAACEPRSSSAVLPRCSACPDAPSARPRRHRAVGACLTGPPRSCVAVRGRRPWRSLSSAPRRLPAPKRSRGVVGSCRVWRCRHRGPSATSKPLLYEHPPVADRLLGFAADSAGQPLVDDQRMPAASALGDRPGDGRVGHARDDDLASDQAAHALADAEAGRPVHAEQAEAVGVIHRGEPLCEAGGRAVRVVQSGARADKGATRVRLHCGDGPRTKRGIKNLLDGRYRRA
jgi:hypothetical protein